MVTEAAGQNLQIDEARIAGHASGLSFVKVHDGVFTKFKVYKRTITRNEDTSIDRTRVEFKGVSVTEQAAGQ